MVGYYLNLSEQDLTAIDRENDTEAQQKVTMLDTWYEKEGSNATYLNLANALHQHGRKDLVELLCRTVKPTTVSEDTVSRTASNNTVSETMFHSNEEDIKSRFATLLRRVRLALETANHITTEEVRELIVGMFTNSDDCIPKTNLEEIISAVTKERLWDYMHHSPVEKLLHRLLPDHISLISEYKEYLSGYAATTKLIDYIEYAGVNSRRGSNEIPLGNFTKRHYQRLTVKLDIKRNITLLSLKYVQDLWKQFAEEFHIPFLTAVICEIDRGCIEITWLVLPDITEKIAESANKSIRFFRENNIVRVALDDNPIYDQLEVCTVNIIISN